MTICLIGKNLTSLVLSKIFVNKGINVDLYYSNNKINKMKSTLSRTIGLSNDSVNFLESYKILNKKDCWNIKQIKLYKENEPDSFLNFKTDKNSFSIISYNVLNESLETKLKKNKRIKIKKRKYEGFYPKLLKRNYEIIIITDTNNFLFKKYFSKQFKKNYNSTAYTTIINHSKIQNNIAEQYFTRFGPLAFLPISNNQTSVVFSIFDKDLIKNKLKIKNIIEQYNRHYQIKNISTLQEFPINLFLSRNYFYKNILSFGDALHKVHPLAGQGFNMTVRDTKILSDLIDKNLALGLNLDTILEKFEIERKNPNFIFAMGIDFLHEFFKATNKYNLKNVDYLFKFLNKNTFFKKKIEKFADKGFIF
ncbi:FAD-dependent monooxygenase [Candidatus Pelagibacter communis]|uniref:FAD-dependent monooxygenase n=1 Tax=Pelagibacter ubique TaxID=198252 RepID=UPI00094CFA32|nr:FAD-dependent monooxygenase [Candidatus Pelagibacter ubique]